MQTVLETGAAALQLLVLMTVGWIVVFVVAQLVETRIRRNPPRGRPSIFGTLSWLWEYSNIIGIPALLVGTAYLVWAMYWGPGLDAGPTMLIILLMSAAGLLIGLAPSMRRR